MPQDARQQHAVDQTEEADVMLAGKTMPRPVRVIAGADVQDMDLAGRTVGEARAVAQAIFGINDEARALIDGHEAQEDQLLHAGQIIEFVKHAGQKGALQRRDRNGASSKGSTIEMAGHRVVWKRNGESLAETTVGELLSRIAGVGPAPQGWQLHPRQVRLMAERRGGSVRGLVIEMPPGPREVRCITDDSKAPLGAEAKYRNRRLSFPWVVLIVVFADGELTNVQQAFYRPAPIASLDDELFFTNLLNVARGYEQESWVCLVSLAEAALDEMSWEERTRAVTDHFWQASFNRSSEIHEGNSYWDSMRDVDPRLENASAWEAATAADPYFALHVPWRPAPHPIGETLRRMLDLVAPWRPLDSAEQLATLMQRDEV